jgi:lysophospholipase L1-like esterase
VLVQVAQRSQSGPNWAAPKILLLAPPPVEKLAGTDFAEMFKGAEEKSENLSREFRRVAEELGCEFLDTADVIVSSKLDAIHLDAEEHHKLGEAVAARVQEILDVAQ